MTRIGLLSDTHGCFDQKLKDFFEPVDQLWHAGDFGDEQTADGIAAFKPLTGVYGNCDPQDLRLSHPYSRCFTLEGMKILMVHIGGYPPHYQSRALALIEKEKPQIFVCGHSHILKIMYDKRRDMLCLNPGAAGIFGFHTVRTALRFVLKDGKISDMELGQWERQAAAASCQSTRGYP